jgi:serine/threonine kinase 32
MDDKFLTFDYTRTDIPDQHHRDSTTSTPIESTPSLVTTMTEMTLSPQTTIEENFPTGGGGVGTTGTRLLRKVESALDHYEQSKYKAQGYVLTPDG